MNLLILGSIFIKSLYSPYTILYQIYKIYPNFATVFKTSN